METLERLTLVVPGVEIPRGVALVATFTKPYDEDKILRKFQGEQQAERRRQNGKTYLVNGDAALHFVNDRTVLVGETRGVSSLLGAAKKNDGPLLGALRLAARNSVVAGFQPGSLPAEAAQDIPDEYKALKPLMAAKMATLRLNPGQELEMDLFLTFGTESARQAAAKSARTALTMGQTVLAVLIPTLSKDSPDSLRVKDVRIRSEGLRLHVPLRIKVDTATLAGGLEVLLQAERKNRLREEIANNIRNLALAMHTYEAREGTLPPAAIYSKEGKPLLSWRVAMLRELEDPLYEQFKLDEPWDSAQNKKLLAKMPKVFRSPGMEPKEPHSTFYQVFTGKGSVFEGKKPPSIADISNGNGTAGTLLIVEADEAVPWTKPVDLPFAADKPLPPLGGGPRKEGIVAAFADGHVEIIPKKTDEKSIKAMITWRGEE
jgi:hypothetical protein